MTYPIRRSTVAVSQLHDVSPAPATGAREKKPKNSSAGERAFTVLKALTAWCAASSGSGAAASPLQAPAGVFVPSDRSLQSKRWDLGVSGNLEATLTQFQDRLFAAEITLKPVGSWQHTVDGVADTGEDWRVEDRPAAGAGVRAFGTDVAAMANLFGPNRTYTMKFAWLNNKASLQYHPALPGLPAQNSISFAIYRPAVPNNNLPVQVIVNNATGGWSFTSIVGADDGVRFINPANAPGLTAKPAISAPPAAPADFLPGLADSLLSAPVELPALAPQASLSFGTSGRVNASLTSLDEDRVSVRFGWAPSERPVGFYQAGQNLLVYVGQQSVSARRFQNPTMTHYSLVESSFGDANPRVGLPTAVERIIADDYPYFSPVPERSMRLTLRTRNNATGTNYNVEARISGDGWLLTLKPTQSTPILRYHSAN